ncbi:MAG TPA: hypothetical protein VEN28_03575, partial [Burkholderiaceae bacterium]|nr:hypothetical protein [Burkholderiaceae bacterium]
MNAPDNMPRLAFGLDYAALYARQGLVRLDTAFFEFLGAVDPALRERLGAARKDPAALAPKVESDLLVALAPHVEDFLAHLFGIESEAQALAAQHHNLAPLYSVKRLFVQRRALRNVKPQDAAGLDGAAAEKELGTHFGGAFTELVFARFVTEWQKDETTNAPKLELAARYAAWAATTPEGKAKHHNGVLF